MRLTALSLCLGLVLATTAAAAPDPGAGLTQLHQALHLTPDQEAAWSDYAAAVIPGRDVEARHRATQQMLPQLTTPRRIALIDATMDRDNDDLHRKGAAVLAFYNRLSPEQQRIFDRQTLALGNAAQRGGGQSESSGDHPLKMPPAN
jgi:hypothetical protein